MGEPEIASEPVLMSPSSLQDMLRCPVCLKSYNERDHLPKLLDCHHTICLACLKVIVKEAHHQRFPNHSVARCPQCRTIIQTRLPIESTPTNFYIQTFRHAVINAQRQNQDAVGNGDMSGEFVFPQCSTHTDNNVRISTNIWCEQCKKAVCSMCLVESPHDADHIMILVPEKIRRLKNEAESFRTEIEEMQNCSARNREALLQNLTRLTQVADLLSQSVKRYDEKVVRERESIQIPKDEIDSILQKVGPRDIATIVDYVERVREAKRNLREFVETSRMEDISQKLERVIGLMTDVTHEIIDEFKVINLLVGE